MNPNPLTSEPPPEFEPDEDVVLEFDEEGRRAMADWKWMHEQHLLGHLKAYAGEYVGVFEQTVVGHNPSLIALRAEVERLRGIPPSRLATTYVADSKGTGVGRMWLA
jgi:hypothetical protein